MKDKECLSRYHRETLQFSLIKSLKLKLNYSNSGSKSDSSIIEKNSRLLRSEYMVEENYQISTFLKILVAKMKATSRQLLSGTRRDKMLQMVPKHLRQQKSALSRSGSFR